MSAYSDKLVSLIDQLVLSGQECSSGSDGGGDDPSRRQAAYKQAAHGVLGVKSLNRQIAQALDVKRREIEQHKDRVDVLHLKLENLLYKRAYLLREIQECRDFATPALDTIEAETSQRLAVQDFNADLPRRHAEALSFLEKEGERREAAKRELEVIRADYLAREEVLDGRRKIVDELPVRITNVESAVLNELNPIFAKGDAILANKSDASEKGADKDRDKMEIA